MSGTKLFDAGHTDLVLIRPKSKAPAREGWLFNRPTREDVDAWEGNLGVIGELTPAIDIDLYDKDLAWEVARHVVSTLGPAPVRLSHREASLLLPYRCNTPYPKKVLTLPDGKGKVEVLGRGRQYLVHGIHPEGTAYRWQGKALWDVPPHELGSMEEKHADALLESLQEIYGGTITRGRGMDRVREDVDREELLAPTPDHVREALQRIPNTDAFLFQAFPDHPEAREAWMAMAHAVYGAGGPELTEDFVQWTLTYEGPADADHARQAYESCADTYTGWPTLDRILRTFLVPTAHEDFPPDQGPAPEPIIEYPDSIHLTDEWIVDRIAARCEHEVRVAAKKWYVWDGRVWREGDALRAERVIRKHLRVMALKLEEMSLACDELNEKLAEQLAKRARYVQNAAGITNVVKLVKAYLVGQVDDFDADPYLLNTPGGVVDLKTGKSRPNRPADFMSRCTTTAPAAEYIPAEAPHWESFLDHLCGGDEDLAAYLQRFAGYALTGDMSEKALLVAWGSNHDTGKSTFVNTLSHVMGDYAISVEPDVFMQRRGANYTLARLPGRRLVTATEPSSGQKWDDRLVKAVTGRDPIEARAIYGSPFTFVPTFKLLIAGNHEPELANVDTALLRRINIVPMNNKVTHPDPDMERKLQREAPAILRWMIDGALAWQEQGGLAPPALVEGANEQYRETEDILEEWRLACCDMDGQATSRELFASWQQFCKEGGIRGAFESVIGFSRAITARAPEWELGRWRSNTDRGFEGIQVKPRIRLGTEDRFA